MYDAPQYVYDYNGNTLTKVVGSNTTSYAWDYENRLTSVTLPGSGGTVSFAYDPFGRRIEKISPTTTSIFAYDGDNLIEATNSSGTAVARYSDGLNIDEPLAMLRSSTTSYYDADGLGSITSLSSSAGSLAQTYGYDSFGKQTSSSGSLTNPFQYTARESDPETGLYYYRARYYDPTTGRFLSEDPIEFRGGVDFYRYVRNSPNGLIDPLGLWTFQIGLSVNYTLPFAVTGSLSFGFAIDTHGHFGTYTMRGVGLGEGAGASAGISVGVSNANTICGLGGPFLNVSGTAGVDGLGGTGDYFEGAGDGPGGVVRGGGATIGLAGGVSGSAQRTWTTVHPFGGCSCTSNGKIQ